MKAITVAFVSENCLPFSIGPKLVDYAKTLAKDKTALSKLSLSRTALTYTLTHGVAKSFQDKLSDALKGSFFSLNVDEATNNAMDKVVNVLVQYYDDSLGKVVVDHLGTRKQNIATSENLAVDLDSILTTSNLSWNQVVSCLMDNCSVMRGVRSGVEARIRKERNQYLLDINGDTVHIVSNAAKAFCQPFGQLTENFSSDVYYDLEKSPKQKELFAELQTLMNYSKTKPLVRPISSRFLQMIEVTSRLSELLDPLVVYYYSFLAVADKVGHENDLNKILKKHLVSNEAKARITEIQLHLSKQIISNANDNRKGRIIKLLFAEKLKLSCHFNLYRGVLPKFQKFVKMFQCEKPMIHVLLSQIFSVTSEFLAMYIKPSEIPQDIAGLVKLNCCDSKIQFSDKNLVVGPFCFTEIAKARLEKLEWVKTFYANLREGYQKAGKSLIDHLPLSNKNIACLAALDPCMWKDPSIGSSFQTLAESLPNIVDPSLIGYLQAEIRSYSVDSTITELGYIKMYEKKKIAE